MNAFRSGFTILELLVAIAVFALLGLMGQQVNDGLSRASISAGEHDKKLKMLQQTMSFISHDLMQIMPRPVRGERGRREPALLAGKGVLGSDNEGLRFVRGGVVNPQMHLPRSALSTVGYRIRGGYLERLSWPVTDATVNTQPAIQKLIQVKTLTLNFYDGTRWLDNWTSIQSIPVAVRMTLLTSEWGQLERIWLLRGSQVSAVSS